MTTMATEPNGSNLGPPRSKERDPLAAKESPEGASESGVEALEPDEIVDDFGLSSHLDADEASRRIVERHLIVPPELAGLRLDHFVKTQISRLSRTKIQVIIDTQLTRAAGGTAKPATIVAAGDHFVIRREARPEPPCPRTFTVIHQDARVLVVDKPAGLPVHASAKFYFNTLARVLSERYPDEPDLQLCHRLDRETSGCLVVARDREAASFIKPAIADKRRTPQRIPGRRRRSSAVIVGLDHPPRHPAPHLDRRRRHPPPPRPRHPRSRRPARPDPRPRRTSRPPLLRHPLHPHHRSSAPDPRPPRARRFADRRRQALRARRRPLHRLLREEGLTPRLADLFILSPRHALHAALIEFRAPGRQHHHRHLAPAPGPGDGHWSLRSSWVATSHGVPSGVVATM